MYTFEELKSESELRQQLSYNNYHIAPLRLALLRISVCMNAMVNLV